MAICLSLCNSTMERPVIFHSALPLFGEEKAIGLGELLGDRRKIEP
jgi:hypothetical protein